MGKSSSGSSMQAYHRKQHKKTLKKNKDKRIKERDEKVVESKTVTSVQEEMRNLKKRKNNLQFAEQVKLQRLEKELKLVQEAAEAAKQNQDGSTYQAPKKANVPLTELDDPRKSVYYDAMMNPYGAPPPGRPRLYHQRGGGVTMDMRMAIVPGEEPPPPPPPPPLRPQIPPNHRRDHQQHYPNRQSSAGSGQQQKRHQQQHGRQSPPTKGPHSTTASDEPHMGSTSAPQSPSMAQEIKEEKNEKPLTIPELPSASKAVQRSHKSRRRGKAANMVDIWASTEEVDYERRVNNKDLEAEDVGVVKKKKKKKKKPPLEYWYKDLTQQVQGPFQKDQINSWRQAGFFPPTIMFKTSRNEQWLPIDQVPSLVQSNGEPPSTKEKTNHAADDDDDTNRSSSLQDRINALKGKKETTIADRIAQLRGDPVKEVGDDAANTRPISELDDENTADPSQLPRAPVDEDTEQAGNSQLVPLPPPPPPPSVSTAGTEEVVSPYPANFQDSTEASLPEPPPYPVDSDDIGPTYPVDNSLADIPYPVDNGSYPDNGDAPAMDYYPAPYPVEGGEDDPYVGYPTEDAYAGANDEAPPIGVYPQAPQEQEPLEKPTTPVTKKVIKVDKALIAFKPSHLGSKKRKTKQSQVPSKKVKIAHNTEKDDGDYEDFMKEVDDV